MLPIAATFVLFDMDGTLLRLSWDAPAVRPLRDRVREVLRTRGLAPPYGMMIPTLAQVGRTDPGVAGLLSALESASAEGAVSCSGAMEVLSDLAGRCRAPCALVTSNGRACAERALEVAGLSRGHFAALVCREDVDRLKPDPEPLRKALALLIAAKGPPQRVLLVGDAATDMQAAAALLPEVACPLLRIGVLGGVSSLEALRAAAADAVIASLHELLPLVRGDHSPF